MPYMPQPLLPQGAAQIVRLSDAAYASSGLSPQSRGIQLPAYGAWDLRFVAWTGNPNSAVHVFAKVVWFKYDLSGSGAFLLAKTDMIGTPTLSKTILSGTNIVSGLTLSDPDVNGIITATVSWTGGTSQTPRIIAQGFQWAQTADFSA